MKKYMIADLIKSAENEADAAIRAEVAESLGVEPGDVDDDDVENFMSMGGVAKGELKSSVGPIQWLYDNKAKAYIVYMLVTTSDKPRDIIYNIEPSVMKEWINSESMGEYWNSKIRSNKSIENAASSLDFPIGGCDDNLLDPSTVRRFNTRFTAIS